MSSAFVHAQAFLAPGEKMTIYSNPQTSDGTGAATFTFARIAGPFRVLGWYLATSGTTGGGQAQIKVDSNQVGPVAHFVPLPLNDYSFDNFRWSTGQMTAEATGLDATTASRLFVYLAFPDQCTGAEPQY